MRIQLYWPESRHIMRNVISPAFRHLLWNPIMQAVARNLLAKQGCQVTFILQILHHIIWANGRMVNCIVPLLPG